MVKNQGAFRILSSTAFETVKIQREEKQKSLILEQFFYFQLFQTSGNLEIMGIIKKWE